ncbi:MAG: DUF4402 domain-containing protein [Sphingopyxis sp.]|nr:DUF4402 domain-containing protein [Sphingopyxis sp.]
MMDFARLLLLRQSVLAALCLIGMLPVEPAAAQCLLCGDTGSGASAPGGNGIAPPPGGERPLRIDIVANLEFARIVAGPAGGSVVVDAASGRAAPSGAISTLSGPSFSARVRIEGTPGAAIRIDLPNEAILTSSTGAIARLSAIDAALPPVVRLDANGRFEFSFGGRLDVTGSVDGDFRGRIPVTVSYA